MRRRISREETFVSEPISRPFQGLPVRPITPYAPVPQFRQLRINDVINNAHDVVNLDLQRWMEMGLNEFSRHDVLMKVPGFPLTRYRLVSSFRRDFENPPLVSLFSSHGHGSSDVDIPDAD